MNADMRGLDASSTAANAASTASNVAAQSEVEPFGTEPAACAQTEVAEVIGRVDGGAESGSGQRRKEFASPSIGGERARVVQRREAGYGETLTTPRALRRTLSFMPPTPEEIEGWGSAALWRGDGDAAASVVRGVEEVTSGLARSGIHGDTPELKQEASAMTREVGEASPSEAAVEMLAAELAQSHIGDKAKVGGEGGSAGVAPGWQFFTPAIVDRSKCMARTWKDGNGGQCRTRPGFDGRLCKMHAEKKGGLTWLGEVDGDIPEAKLKEFQAEWRKRQARGQDDGSERGLGVRGRRAGRGRGVGESERRRGQEGGDGGRREEGVGGGEASGAGRAQAAEAA